MVVYDVSDDDGGKENWKKFKPVTIGKHSGSPSKDCPPEAKAAIVVDRVVGLQLVVIDDFEQADDDT